MVAAKGSTASLFKHRFRVIRMKVSRPKKIITARQERQGQNLKVRVLDSALERHRPAHTRMNAERVRSSQGTILTFSLDT
jgi:hypothetical protein